MDRKITDLFAKICQTKTNGYRLADIPKGVLIKALTANAIYVLTKTAEGKNPTVAVSGGLVPKPLIGEFSGSTLGGHAIKVGWLGKEMYLEIYLVGGKILTTSLVQKITLENSPHEADALIKLAEENTRKKLS